MSKICPDCKYPNLDKAEVCFKCGADISAETIRETQARERREAQENRQRERNERNRINEQRQTESRQRINQTVQDYVYNENTEYFRNAYSSLSNCIRGIYILLGICILDIILGILIGCLSENNADNVFVMTIGGIVGCINCGFLLAVFKWMQSNLISQQKTVLMLENISRDRENSTPDLSVLQEINTHLINIENYYADYSGNTDESSNHSE